MCPAFHVKHGTHFYSLLFLFTARLLTLVAALFLHFGGFLGLLQRLFLEGWQTGLGSAGVLMNMITLFLRFGGRRSRSREDVDLPDGTQQIADVVGEPVHQHSERHGNTGENVHDREHPQHHLLHHFGLLVCRRLSHVTLHAVVLHEPQAEAHQCNEDGDNYFAMHGGGREIGRASCRERV